MLAKKRILIACGSEIDSAIAVEKEIKEALEKLGLGCIFPVQGQ